MKDLPFRCERRDRVTIFWIGRPPVNALRFSDYADLARLLRALDAAGDASCVVLAGEGTRAFIGGHDLNEFAAMTPADLEAMLPLAQDLHKALIEAKLPIIAAVTGAAIGNGLAIAALCDYRIAAKSATFSLPEIKRGVIGGAAAIARLVPDGVMRRLVLTGEKIDAAHALEIGLVDEVGEFHDVVPRGISLAMQIASNRPEALRLLRPALPALRQLPYLEAYALECRLSQQLRDKLGVEAAKDASEFFQKR